MNRRQFVFSSAAAAGWSVPRLHGADSDSKTRLGLVRSTHAKLAQPAPLDDLLTYAQVRDMVFTAIGYGAPQAGSLAAKIKPGSWVVLKPNIVFLRPHPSYAPGDITDFRVTRAVLEYVATCSRAGRITIAEGGTYRRPTDQAEDNVVLQGGKRVSAYDFDWGPHEFPGFHGSLGGMIREFAQRHPDKKFDYVDLSYDAVRNPDGSFRRILVPKASNGVGAFGARPDYFVTNTILGCDFLISIPVMKVHLQSGITAVLKNYVGTAPREAYARPGGFHNAMLHDGHSAGGRIDPFIVDLAAFHPPDFCVVDGIRGLQSHEHFIQRDDQTVQSNLILAGEDPVAADAMVAKLLGFNPWDMDFLHMAQKRQMGRMNIEQVVDLRGDDPGQQAREWEKPKHWYGRCNRLWQVCANEGAPRSLEAPFDTIDLPALTRVPPAPGVTYRATANLSMTGNRRGYLWIGLRGSVTARLNGEVVARRESQTRYRVGQFHYPVTLRPGRNHLEFRIEPRGGQALLSALLTGPRNNGDTIDGLRWLPA